ncbi:permease-like cell division protein FtsX [Dactylosporangium sp. McL0621]|uniref:permease-like cell division protein FtsX n=1 Tax=Dactylosporangium sp. McL0621 TaxID=3415678 RepID=UPI003CF92A2E
MPPIADVPAEPIAVVAPDPPRRRRPLLVAAAALVLLLVAGAGFAGGFLAGRPPAERYLVTVYMKTDAGDADKAGVRKALEGLHPDGAVRYVTKEQAAAKAQETFKDNAEVLKYMTADNLPESFEADVVTRTITCAGIAPIWKLTGVDKVTVLRKYHGKVPGAQIGC